VNGLADKPTRVSGQIDRAWIAAADVRADRATRSIGIGLPASPTPGILDSISGTSGVPSLSRRPTMISARL
jgi:hypothetical protein